jgi:hypothetical protein
MELFDKEKLEELIGLFAKRMSDAGVTGKISIVGGAALSVAYIPDRAATTDIDATYPNDPRVPNIINQIAEEFDLPTTWINNAVNAYIPFETSEMWVHSQKVGGIEVRYASAELLLAMKLKADRGRRDRPDIAALINLCGLTAIEEVESIYEHFHHQEVLSPRTKGLVLQMLTASAATNTSL